MATANDVMQSTEPTTDALSPTTLILNALRKSGQQPTNANIRRYVEAMARQPNAPGTDIPGLRIGTPSSEAEDQAAMRAAGKGGSRSGGGGGGGRSTLPVDLGHGPTNEADWQPNTAKTTSASPIINTPATIAARPDLQNVTNMQNTTNPAMYAAVPEVPLPPQAPQAAAPPVVPLPPPPPETTPWGEPVSPWGAPRAPRDVTTSIDEAVAPRSPGLQVENVPMPPPQQTIQAPPADSIPPSGGLSIEDRMMPGRGNLTIQAPSASSMPPTQAPVIQETAPSFKRMLGGAATGAGVGRIMGPGGMALGAVLGAAPEAWNLGKHIIGQ
jgi:hypothetical protein